MDSTSTMILYGFALLGLVLSFLKDRGRTALALEKARKTFLSILAPLTTVILLVSLALTALPPSLLTRLMGDKSGLMGALTASLAGSVTLIPGFAAFPMAKMLLDHGAGIAQIGVLVSTLMMVGVVTMPMERAIFGWRATWTRNLFAYVHSLAVGLVLWLLLR